MALNQFITEIHFVTNLIIFICYHKPKAVPATPGLNPGDYGISVHGNEKKRLPGSKKIDTFLSIIS
jgi:hypothetical protein